MPTLVELERFLVVGKANKLSVKSSSAAHFVLFFNINCTEFMGGGCHSFHPSHLPGLSRCDFGPLPQALLALWKIWP